jgi:hypothetical protein
MRAPAVCILAGQGDRAVNSILIAIPAHHWHNVGADNWVGIAGLWVSVVGLIIAIGGPGMRWWRTRRARKAEREELEERFHVQQVRDIVTDLDAAIVADDPERIQRQLEKWREEAAYVYSLLRDARSDTATRCMWNSVSLARQASNALLRGEPAVSAYMDARDAITKARDALIIWVSRQSRRADLWWKRGVCQICLAQRNR